MKNIHITRIVLRKFKGFKTTNIDTADITMKKKLQQLVSTNGSGKSTFLSEFSLDPINKELFYPGGGKDVYFQTDEGDKYLALSTLKGHILKDVNGSTITQGNTISHYVETLQTLFDYDSYKWKIVTGQLKFTELNRSDRQKWIEAISGVDFTYPFKIYNAIRGQISGVRRAVKEYEAELANSGQKLLADELRLEMEDRRTQLGDVISHIISNKSSNTSSEGILSKIEQFRQLDNQLAETKKRILNAPLKCFDFLNVDSLEEFRDRWLQQTSELDRYDMLFQQKQKELTEKLGLRNKLSTEKEFDMEGAQTLLNKTHAELEELQDLTGSDYMDTFETTLRYVAINRDDILQNVQLAVMNQVSDANGRIDHTMTKEDRHALIIRLNNMESELRKETDTRDHLEELIQTTLNGKDITCPKCSEVFKDGEGDIANLRIKLSSANDAIGILNVRITKDRQLLSEVNEIDSNIELTRKILDTHLTLHAVRHPLEHHLDGSSTLDDLLRGVDFYLEMARNSYRIMQAKRTIQELEKEIDYHKNLAKLGSVEDFANKCDALERELIDIRNVRTKVAERIKKEENIGKELRAYIAELDNLETLSKRHTELLDDVKHELLNAANGKLLESLQIELAKLASDLNDDKITAGIRDRLDVLIRDNKAKLKVLSDLEVAINPSTGIIAEQLIAYCRLFSGYTTQLLSKIWGYDMTMQEPIVHPTRGVNYRFPMTVKDDELISDISNGSTSQKSIMNLAINMASRTLLKADAQPLFLDEVGAGFDTIHNIALGDFLYELTKTSPSKNIMVIHHDMSIRQQLGDCDTIVFDPSQVVIDEGEANEHVVLTYRD